MQRLKLYIQAVLAFAALLKEIRYIIPIIKNVKLGTIMKLFLIFSLLFFTSCVSQSVQKLNPLVYYKNDLSFEYKLSKEQKKNLPEFLSRFGKQKYRKRLIKSDVITFHGVGTLPYAKDYNFKVIGFAKFDYFSATSCHEELVSNDRNSWFKKNGETDLSYAPTLERGKNCPLFIATYSKTQKHGFGLLVFEDPRYKLKAELHCNGYLLKTNGVSICQSKMGLLQKIVFDEEVHLLDPVKGAAERRNPCPEIKITDGKSFEYLIPARECVYGFIGKKSREIHQHHTVGYENIIVR